jgi:hypothetical protein
MEESAILDVTPLLQTLSKLSSGRILPVVAEHTTEGDLTRVTIPVREVNPADRTDRAMRQYASDWIRKHGKFTVDARYQKLVWQSWFDDSGAATPLAGVIVLQWWPQPELTEMEQWERESRLRRERSKDD